MALLNCPLLSAEGLISNKQLCWSEIAKLNGMFRHLPEFHLFPEIRHKHVPQLFELLGLLFT